MLPRVGIELELMAPPGRDRRELARVLAGPEGRVVPFLHPDSEPSLVPGQPIFENLTLGFRVQDVLGRTVAHLVDDLTLQDDLDRRATPKPGWWRIVGDDRRLLHLVRRHGRADAGPVEALAPVARLFGVEVEHLDGGIVRVRDPDGMPVALGAPLPGERERPCELVTAPLGPSPSARALESSLERLLAPARSLGFTVPTEAAVHLHFDAAPFRNPGVLARLVRAYEAQRTELQARFATNPACRRLGSWPGALRELVDSPGFEALSWEEARPQLRALEVSKYTDLNLRNVVFDVPGKPTLEVRFLPGAIEAGPVVAAVAELTEWLRGLGAEL